MIRLMHELYLLIFYEINLKTGLFRDLWNSFNENMSLYNLITGYTRVDNDSHDYE